MQRTEYRRSAPDYGYGGYGSYNPGEEAAYKRGESNRLRREQRQLEQQAYREGMGYYGYNGYYRPAPAPRYRHHPYRR